MTTGRTIDSPEELIVPTIPEAELKKVVSDDIALERFLALQVSLNNDGVYFEPNCPICNSFCRKDVEEKWLKDRNSDDIRDFLKSKGEPVPLTVIKNHMEYHIDQSYIELRKKEYVQKILTLSRINLNTLSRVEMALSSIGERLISVNAAEDPGESPAALEKARADSTCKLVASMAKLLELRASLMGEMQDSGNLLSVRQEDFEAIFKEILSEYKSAESREIVKTILDKFSKVARKK